jgi:hypothetical protein|tara:strand:+ start:1157 stop:1417 length:261 start_codon:yes stop_codon:yes gene_type:complete
MSEYVTVKDNLDYQNVSIEIEGEEVLVLCEIDVSILQEVCLVDCGKFNSENKLYKLDNGQYLYKGVCCGVYTLLEANGEDNGLATR